MTLVALHSIALGACAIASSALYLSGPNQQWLHKRPLKVYPMALAAGLLLIGAWKLFQVHMSTLSAFFSVLTAVMLCLSLLPFAVRLKQPLRHSGGRNTGITKSPQATAYRPQWWLRTVGSVLLAFPLSVSSSGLLAFLGPGELSNGIKTQLVMWLIAPLFLLPISLVFFAKSARATLVCLLALNLTTALLLAGLRAGE